MDGLVKKKNMPAILKCLSLFGYIFGSVIPSIKIIDIHTKFQLSNLSRYGGVVTDDLEKKRIMVAILKMLASFV